VLVGATSGRDSCNLCGMIYLCFYRSQPWSYPVPGLSTRSASVVAAAKEEGGARLSQPSGLPLLICELIQKSCDILFV